MAESLDACKILSAHPIARRSASASFRRWRISRWRMM